MDFDPTLSSRTRNTKWPVQISIGTFARPDLRNVTVFETENSRLQESSYQLHSTPDKENDKKVPSVIQRISNTHNTIKSPGRDSSPDLVYLIALSSQFRNDHEVLETIISCLFDPSLTEELHQSSRASERTISPV